MIFDSCHIGERIRGPSVSTSAELIEREIVERRDRLVSRRTELLRQRAELISELRRIDVELKDCAATARFFGLLIDFPPDERDEYERIRIIHRERETRERELARARIVENESRQSSMHLESASRPLIPHIIEEVSSKKQENKNDSGRPTVKVVSLNLLEGAGVKGIKAERIRDYIDRTYGLAVHEKTVGMTLYRLSLENLAHRVGHTWFFGPAKTETKDPGVGTPGSGNDGA